MEREALRPAGALGGGQGRGRTVDLPIFSRPAACWVPHKVIGTKGIATTLSLLEPREASVKGQKIGQNLSRTPEGNATRAECNHGVGP